MSSDRTGFIAWTGLSQTGVIEGSAVVEFYADSLLQLTQFQLEEMVKVRSRIFQMNAEIKRFKGGAETPALATARIDVADGGRVESQPPQQQPNSRIWKGAIIFNVECDFAL